MSGFRWGLMAALVTFLWAGQMARADTLLSYAIIREISPKLITVSLDSGTETAMINDKTRAYRKQAIVAATDFPIGERVRVRIKRDGKEPFLREIMDLASEKWIDRIRHEYIRAEVKSTDPGRVTMKLDDGTEFIYKITPSTKIEQKGVVMGGSTLIVGTVLWVKGKGLSSLDTQLAHATDSPPTDKRADKVGRKTSSAERPRTSSGNPENHHPRATRTTKSSSSNRLPFTNTADGTVDLVLSNLGQLDLKVAGRLMHFRWTPRTQFFIGENPAVWQDLSIGLPVTVYFYRDGIGRLVLSRVQMP